MLRAVAPLMLAFAQTSAACATPANPTRPPAPGTPPTAASGELRTPAAFAAAFRDPAARSRALFLEATRVLLHPRCTNCHPDGDSPLQGDAPRMHDPPV